MADDPNPELRAELMAALAVLAPQIRGLHDLDGVSISMDLKAEVDTQILAREQRRNLIQTSIDELDAVVRALTMLEADGYPALEPVPVMSSLFQELREEVADVEAAAGVFKADQAMTMSIGLGTPQNK